MRGRRLVERIEFIQMGGSCSSLRIWILLFLSLLLSDIEGRDVDTRFD